MAVDWKQIMIMLLKGVSQSRVAGAVHCSKRDVARAARVVREHGVAMETLVGMDAGSVRDRWFPSKPREADSSYAQPGMDSYVERKGLYRRLPVKFLWYDYRNKARETGLRLYSYQSFCRLFAERCAQLDVTARLEHRPGEKAFIDWCGDCPRLLDPVTGRRAKVQVLVVVLPYSGLIYAEGFPDQRMESWLTGVRHALEEFGGVPNILVPDQCATAVDRAPRGSGEVRVNRRFAEFAEHYGTAVVPARAARPRDKALVEAAVDLVEQWAIAPADDMGPFRMLAHLNEYITCQVEWLNLRKPQDGSMSRRERFEGAEESSLLPLPAEPFETCRWRKAKVPANYHIRVEHMNYSVPHRLAGRVLDVKLTTTKVVAYHNGEQVASHCRLHGAYGQYATIPAHMPDKHRDMRSPWSRERFESWADAVGPETGRAIRRLLDSKPMVEQAYVPCSNILNLSRKYGSELLELACTETNRDDRIASLTGTRHRILAIRDAKRGEQATPTPRPARTAEDHAGNVGRVRGADAYKRTGREGAR